MPSMMAVWRTKPNAPMPGTYLCQVAEIADGGVREFVYGHGKDQLSLMVMRHGERIRGYVNSCPHFWVPLNVGPSFTLFDDYVLCMNHYAMFRIEDGYCEDGPCLGTTLDGVPLRMQDGRLSVAE